MADLATPRSPKFVARDSLNTARRAASSAKRAKCCSWVRQLPIYNLKAAILLSESSALLSFHTTSYSKYLQKFAFKFRSFGLPTEGPRKHASITPILESDHICRASPIASDSSDTQVPEYACLAAIKAGQIVVSCLSAGHSLSHRR